VPWAQHVVAPPPRRRQTTEFSTPSTAGQMLSGQTLTSGLCVARGRAGLMRARKNVVPNLRSHRNMGHADPQAACASHGAPRGYFGSMRRGRNYPGRRRRSCVRERHPKSGFTGVQCTGASEAVSRLPATSSRPRGMLGRPIVGGPDPGRLLYRQHAVGRDRVECGADG
jgi:hypothetical protein